MPAARIQPQGRVRLNRNSPLFRGLIGAFTPPGPGVTPVGGALMKIGRNGEGYSTNASGESWTASNTALASAWPTWTILAILDGTSTNNDFGGASIYAERPNGTQIVKLGFGDGNTNQAMLVVRDAGNRLALFRGSANVKTDASIPRIIIGTRRASNDHRLYFNGALDSSASGDIPGPFNGTNCIIGNDPQDGRANLGGAAVPLVLVWNRSLTDAEIALISANPWQVFDGQAPMLYAASAPPAYNLTSQPTTQANTSSAGVTRQVHALSGSTAVQANTSAGAAVAQLHALSGAVAAQANSSSGAPVVQMHALAGATSAQQNASVGGAAGQGQALTGSPAAQSNASTSGALARIHKPAGAAATQANAASSGVAVQVHQLAGSAAVQTNSAASGSLSSVLGLAGASAAQSNASSAGASSQVHALAGASAAQANSSTSASVGVNGALTGANAMQANTAAGGAVAQVHALSGAPAVQGNVATSGALTGSSMLAAAPAAQGNAALSGAIAQVHTLGGSACGQANVAAGGRVMLFHLLTATASNQINLSPGGAATDLPPVVYARAPAGLGYSRPFTNTTRPHQVNTRRTR